MSTTRRPPRQPRAATTPTTAPGLRPVPANGDGANGGGPDGSVRRAPSRGRWFAFGALGVAIVALAFLLLSGGNGHTYKLVFQDAGQLVKGDQVQVGGVPVGSVKDIQLTTANQAQITISVNTPIAPLHEGTTAEIRAGSLSGVANRYIALAPGPNNQAELRDGATLPATSTQAIVDLDQIFNTLNPRTRRALQQVVQGSATQYAGVAPSYQASARYFSPALYASNRVLAELIRDQPTFTSFLVSTSRAVTTIASRRDALTSLVGNADQTFAAIGSQSTALTQALRLAPSTLRHGVAVFAALPATLTDLRALVDVSKPNTKNLAPFLADLRPLLNEAQPVFGNLSVALNKPGPNNDLLDATRALPGLESAVSKAAPSTIAALRDSLPVTTFFRPYAPDLVGWLRDFGQTAAYYDANGHYARVSPLFPSFAAGADGVLRPTAPEASVNSLVGQQLQRCPGAATQPPADNSAPFTAGGTLDCNPSQVPAP